MPITAVDDGGGDCGGQIASMSAEAAQGGDGGSLASYPGLSEDGRAPRLMRRDSKHVREVSENTTRWKLCDKPDHVGERLMPVTSEWFYISKRQVAVCRQCKRRQVQRRPKLPDHGGANGGGAKSGVGSLGGVPTPTTAPPGLSSSSTSVAATLNSPRTRARTRRTTLRTRRTLWRLRTLRKPAQLRRRSPWWRQPIRARRPCSYQPCHTRRPSYLAPPRQPLASSPPSPIC